MIERGMRGSDWLNPISLPVGEFIVHFWTAEGGWLGAERHADFRSAKLAADTDTPEGGVGIILQCVYRSDEEPGGDV